MVTIGNSFIWLAGWKKSLLWNNRLSQIEPNFKEGIYMRSFIIIAHFVMIWQQTYGHRGQFLFLIGWFKESSSPLKGHGQIEQNLTGDIYVTVRFFIKIGPFLSVWQQAWPPWAFLPQIGSFKENSSLNNAEMQG